MLTSYAYDEKLNEHYFYRGKDGLSMFSKTLKIKIEKITRTKQKPMDILIEQEIIEYTNAKICHICEKYFD